MTSTRTRIVAAAALAAAFALSPAAAQTPGHPLALPVRYEADRWFVTPVTAGGDTVAFYLDTGGGINMLLAPAAERLRLPVDSAGADGRTMRITPMPAFAAGASIPAPAEAAPFGGRLAVMPYEGEMRTMFPADAQGRAASGFLGRWWFADRVWTFDYPAHRLYLRAPGDVPAVAPEHRVALGFQTDSAGRRTTHFPRIRAAIGGDSVDLLFDTGATVVLSDSALARVGGGPARRGGSFIAQSVLDGWRAKHPDWRVVEGGDVGLGRPLAMIEVPRVDVGGYSVGPVWFAARPDPAFHRMMSSMMDRQVEGALGGSALRYLRVTVDYPDAVALFEKP
jgi:hypothetical protein